MMEQIASIAALYSSSFLYAGYTGLGALWMSSFLKYGGPDRRRFGAYGGGYNDYGGGYGGGYNDYGGGYSDYGGGYNDYGGGYASGYGYNDYGRGKGCNKGCSSKGGGGGYDSHHSKGHSHHDYDSHHHKGKGDCHHKRKKREAAPVQPFQTFDDMMKTPRLQEHHEPKEDEILRYIHDSDSDKCSFRLVCEVSSIRDRRLSRQEWEILQFVRHGDALFEKLYPGEGTKSNSPVLEEYKKVANFGSQGGNCIKMFRSCPYSAEFVLNRLSFMQQNMQAYHL